MTTSDGSTAAYYELPEGATELQDLISYRNLNAQDGEMFRAIYRKGRASHSDELRDAKKVLFYAHAEVARLEKINARKARDAAIEGMIDLINQPSAFRQFDSALGCKAKDSSANAGPMLRCPDCIAESCPCIG